VVVEARPVNCGGIGVGFDFVLGYLVLLI